MDTCGERKSNKKLLNCSINYRRPRGKNKSKFVWMMLSGSKHRGLSRTYNTWILLNRPLRISPSQDVDITQHVLLQQIDGNVRYEPKLLHLFLFSRDGRRTPHVSMDSSLEAFSGNPTDGSFTALLFQAAVLTKYLNELFLSY